MAKKTFKNNLHATDALMHGEMDEAADEILENMSFGRKRKQAASITPRADGAIELAGWQMTPTGLVPPADFTQDDYSAFGRSLLRLDASMQWMLGDYINIGEEREWGDTYTTLAEDFGYSANTLRQYAYVARCVSLSVRTDKLTFTHHQLVAQMTPDLQAEWLNYAVENVLSVSALRKEIKESQLPDRAQTETDETHTSSGWVAGNFVYHKDYGTGRIEEVLNHKFVRVQFEDGTAHDLSEDRIEPDMKAESMHGSLSGGDSSPSRVEPEPVQLSLWDAFCAQQNEALERMTVNELRALRNKMIEYASYIQKFESRKARGS